MASCSEVTLPAWGRSIQPGQQATNPEVDDLSVASRDRAAYSAAPIRQENVDSASGPACAVLRWCGRRVGGLGPGLTSDSADAARAVLRDDLPAGPQVFTALAGGAGLICQPGLEAGVHRSGGPAGACHPST